MTKRRMRPPPAEPAADSVSTPERVRRAAVALFKARGYHGTSVRALALYARIEAASLYHHFPSKQDILAAVFEHVMNDMVEGLEEALAGADDHESRLRRVLRTHILFHIDRQDEAFVSHSELRSLTAANRRRVNAKRDRYEARFRAVLADGVAAGVFAVPDVQLATIAILTMCSSVSDWFADRGRLSADAVADGYAEMVLRMLRPADGPAPARGAAASPRGRA